MVPAWPAPPGVRALCTTRAGGVSQASYDGLNLGTHVGDDPAAVRSNRLLLSQKLGSHPVFLDQVHGSKVVQLDAASADGIVADGAVSTAYEIACTVMVADCLPILLSDRAGRAVAALHAGWRGLSGQGGAGIVEAGVDAFRALAGLSRAQGAHELIAWMGPCIGPRAFEVGEEVREVFVASMPQAAKYFTPGASGKWLADLAALARARLNAAGVKAVYGNDGSRQWCTVSNPLRFFSHRRDGVSGRMAACIWRA